METHRKELPLCETPPPPHAHTHTCTPAVILARVDSLWVGGKKQSTSCHWKGREIWEDSREKAKRRAKDNNLNTNTERLKLKE